MVPACLIALALIAVFCGAILDVKFGCITMAVLLSVGIGIAISVLGDVVILLLGYGGGVLFAGTAICVGFGSLFHRKAAAESTPTTSAQAIQQAVQQFRAEGSVRTRCLMCKGRISARRVLATAAQVPDIEFSCHCGKCDGAHPFRPS
jgi:hypothetical protein